MTNAYGVVLDDASLRWAAAESVPEAVIAAICLLETKSVDEIVARLTPIELGLTASAIAADASRSTSELACIALSECAGASMQAAGSFLPPLIGRRGAPFSSIASATRGSVSLPA